ncbi:PREDICTED: probable low-specificity L-threonine aldolase 1 [Cercocebus atys]|uniref:probable low-specificity L-threonine aldolase 1 n=1 Tax=Cercocebus atys TaxID=9531 RepID=UPI0005F386B0|nr:PREDICTED: probable low-specificity L-threonine aldolase 1 [Cercocebus atys]
MCLCWCRGSQLLLGQECHLHIYEQSGGGSDLPHGTLDLAELERMITWGLRSTYYQVCKLICLENSHSTLGGPGPLHRLPTPGNK